jgi:hypothetical protein
MFTTDITIRNYRGVKKYNNREYCNF